VDGAKGGDQGECDLAKHAPNSVSGLRVTCAGSRTRGPCTCGLLVTHPRWEPDAGKPHVRFCAGGA
jgi:hypothetical protein